MTSFNYNQLCKSMSRTILILFSLTLNLPYGMLDATNSVEHQEVTDEQRGNEVCTSSTCMNEAQFFLKNMNLTADPCDDFYQFVCGNFIKNTIIPDENSEVNMLFSISNELEKDLIQHVKKEIDSADSEAVQKIKIHYQNCLNESSIEEIGTKPLFELFEKLGGWPLLQNNYAEDNYSWEETAYKISLSGLEANFPFMIYVADDSADATKMNLKIKSAKTTITGAFISNNNILKAYEDYMVDIAVMLGVSRDVALQEMKKCLDFEVELYKIKERPDTLLHINGIDNRWSIKELSQKYPNISWIDIFNIVVNSSNVFISESDIAEVEDPKFVSEIAQLINNTPKRVLVNYQFWNLVISVLINYLPKTFDDRTLLVDEVILGINKRPNRETWCIDKIQDTLIVALSAMYVKNFDKTAKARIEELVQDIKSQTKILLEEVAWMDEITRNAALEKLEAMDTLIAYPNELLDDDKVDEFYKDLEVNPGCYFDDFVKITGFLKKVDYRRLRRSPGDKDWTVEAGVAVVNAYYYPQQNKIALPVGILQGYFYPSERPKYINYGSMGYVIGHEITHGFDTRGSRYDKNGNMKNWWANETKDEFNRKSECIIEQYNNYTIRQIGEKMNGNLSAAENIADNGGIKLAYQAYQAWVNRNSITEPRLPGLNYSPQQMFWISAASTWCSKSKDEHLRLLLQQSFHSPNVARVSVAFSNSEYFVNDFHCKIGTNMNPEKKCNIW